MFCFFLLFPLSLRWKKQNSKTVREEEGEKKSEEEFFEKWGQNYHLSRVHLEVSAPCNERCVHCYFPDNYRKGLMPRELFLRILEQCKECNVLSITISGGEPMLNPDLLFFIKECRENNFSINLLTNLTFLSNEMLQEFVKTPLLSVQTSLYSMNADVHDSITSVKGSFEKTKKAIETLYQHDIPMVVFHRVCPEPVPLSPGGPGGPSQPRRGSRHRGALASCQSPAHLICPTSTSERGRPRR